MDIFYNEDHAYHQGEFEMFRGAAVPCFESADRASGVQKELSARQLGSFSRPATFDDSCLTRIHTARYVDFLRTAWNEWISLNPQNHARDAFPSVWPVRLHRSDIDPVNFSARMGLFSFDTGTPLTSGTWRAARGGAGCALSAADAVSAGKHSAFVLSRPPGHHAGADFFGGYCFLNNAALAAQKLRDSGARRVAVLDIDYHHGNGTQSIFYDRPDVLFLSIHGDPRTEYPFFLGYADELGQGAGEGFNLNLPLPCGTAFTEWRAALAHALRVIRRYGADALVVSLGVDTSEEDPISGFRLKSADYLQVGRDISASRLPAVFVLEGGYAVGSIGMNVANVLEGYLNC